MAIDRSAPMTITAPANSDGRGQVVVLNSPTTDANFVGYTFDDSGFEGATVRTSADDIAEGHGQVFGSFYHGARSFTLEVMLIRPQNWATAFANRDKLFRAFNAMAADGTIVWTETGGSARQINFRREQPPRGPDADAHVLLSGICADPRIYSVAALPSGSPITNAGNVGSPPTFTLTPTGGNVVITNTTTSQALTLQVGAGFLSTGSAVTVNFGAKTVTQGGTSKYQAVTFPSSVWWEIIPGSNSYTVSNASSVSISVRSAWL